MIRTSLRNDKKALVGIGTLIVFISMILVAAVAAGVVIRTSGVLQERAFAVAGEARQRLVTGLEVFQVMGNTDFSQGYPQIEEVEIFVRTRPGSPPIQMKTVGFTFSTQEVAFSSGLQHRETELFNDPINYNLVLDEYEDLPMDFNRDELVDRIRLGKGNGEHVIQIWISGLSREINVSLGVNLSEGVDKNISLNEVPIMFDELTYGYVNFDMNIPAADTNESLNITNDELVLRQFTELNVCKFDDLIPELFFCFEPRLGNTDTVLHPGELFVLRYKLRTRNALKEERSFQMSFLPKDGGVTDLEARTPGVISDRKVMLWPS